MILIMRSLHRSRSMLGAVLPAAGAVLLIGIAYGSLATKVGFPAWLVVLTALLVFGASSELLFVGAIAAGSEPLIAALTALVLNIRNALYGVAAGGFLPESALIRAVSAHFVNDEVIAYAQAQGNPQDKQRAFHSMGIALLFAWPVGAAIGAWIGPLLGRLPDLGLDSAFPAIFFALLLPALRDRRRVAAASVSGVIAAATTPFVPSGIAPVLALVGLAVYVKGGPRDE
jgi:predicted branched-subunit amino acid permease